MKITIQNLNKAYGNAVILDDICMSLEGKHSIGIIGESGCGKSTLLRMLSGIERPESGEIEINGQSPIINTKNFQEHIAVVFQKHNLFPHLSVKENITLLLHKIKKWDKNAANDKADTLLKQLHIEKEANKKPHEVSGGQAQRASIARALASNPNLIFLDEPTAALDPLMTNEVLKSIRALKSEGREFIFVTHEIEFLKNFADYVLFMKDGVICEQGDISCLYEPKTEELSRFLNVHHSAGENTKVE